LILLGLVHMLPFVSFAVLLSMGPLLVAVRFSSSEHSSVVILWLAMKRWKWRLLEEGGRVNRSGRKFEAVRVRGEGGKTDCRLHLGSVEKGSPAIFKDP
jgi:hypothetical protein